MSIVKAQPGTYQRNFVDLDGFQKLLSRASLADPFFRSY